MTEPLNPEVVIFNDALELPTGERSAYLDKTCAGNAALRAQVETLLQAHQQGEKFMESLPASADFKRSPLAEIPLTEKPGDKIGRYKLLQQIGEGGCGVVYMAEQEEPVRRRVALKVIKLGMDTKQVIARFEAERQALALMDHQNIAKVLEAGATDTGRPYFVMELVRGIKVTEFCDEQKVSTENRLKLFIQVCQAIQHAHQKGVIHRDIKPSNILVTINDGVPVPKVIDFGIAKATAGRLTDKTLFTAFEQFIGTPAYMSPEQAVMTSLDIDTRSDIYSLGVLLYELLTGKTPFDQRELLAAGFDEMRRTIREKEPPKPSTRLTQELTATEKVGCGAPGVPSLERTEPSGAHEVTRPTSQLKELLHLVRGDLDWIVMKCLEKDRSRRYETANGLATDILRHLNCEPVVARPPSGFYRFQKAIRRNKSAFIAVVVVVTVLLLGVVASTSQAIRARRAEREQIRLREQAQEAEALAKADEQQAKRESAKSKQITAFLRNTLYGASPYSSATLNEDRTVLRAIVDRTAPHIATDLKDQPQVEAEMRQTLAATYAGLGEWDKAEAMAREALRLRRLMFGDTNQFVADSLSQLAFILGNNGKVAEAETTGRWALALNQRLFGDQSAQAADALSVLADVLTLQPAKATEAEDLERKALGLFRKLNGDEHRTVAWTLRGLGLALSRQDKLAEAEKVEREALAMYQKLLGHENPYTILVIQALAGMLNGKDKLPEKESLFREIWEDYKKTLSKNNPHAADALLNLSTVLIQQGKLAEAEEQLSTALKIGRESPANESPVDARLLITLIDVLNREDKQTEALAVEKQILKIESPESADFLEGLADRATTAEKQTEAVSYEREALAMRKKLFGEEHKAVAQSLNSLAIFLLRQTHGESREISQNTLAQAEPLARQALAMRQKLLGTNHVDVAISLETVAIIRSAQGDPTEAESLIRLALQIRRQIVGNADNFGVSDSLIALGDTLNNAGKLSEAETLLREGLAMRQRVWGGVHPQVAYALGHLAVCLQREGKLAEAETNNRESLAMWKKFLDERHSYIAGTTVLLARVLRDEGKLVEAEEQFREALRLRKKYSGDNNPFTRQSVDELNDVLKRQGKPAEAGPSADSQSRANSRLSLLLSALEFRFPTCF